MFLLPNQNKIDEDGVIDAMLDTDIAHRYFLDTITGEVGYVEEKAKKTALPNFKRYREIPKVSAHDQLLWMKECIEICIGDSLLSKSLLAEIQKETNAEKTLLRCEHILEDDKDGWIHGWVEWQGTAGFDEMKQWLATLQVSIEEKFEGCGDCELCKLMEQGEHNLGDFLEAKAKEERKKEKKDKEINEDRSLSLVETERRFLEALKRCGMDGFFSLRTFKKWHMNEKKYDLLFASRALFFLAPEMTTEENGVALAKAAVGLENLIPRRKLGGKSPFNFRESSPQQVEPKYVVDTYDRTIYATLNQKALRLMHKGEYESAYFVYEGILQKLLDERTPFFPSFRAYANAAICCFLGGDERKSLGAPLLDAALRINPLYDFALEMQKYYVVRENDLSSVPKKDKHLAKMLRTVLQRVGADTYRRTPFRKYERFLSECGISLAYKTTTTPTVWKTDEKGRQVKIGRNDPCYCGSGKKYKRCHGQQS